MLSKKKYTQYAMISLWPQVENDGRLCLWLINSNFAQGLLINEIWTHFFRLRNHLTTCWNAVQRLTTSGAHSAWIIKYECKGDVMFAPMTNGKIVTWTALVYFSFIAHTAVTWLNCLSLMILAKPIPERPISNDSLLKNSYFYHIHFSCLQIPPVVPHIVNSISLIQWTENLA